MSFLFHRSAILAIALVSAAILLGFGSSWNITPSATIFSTTYNYGQVIAIGLVYTSWALYKRYI